MSQVTQGRISRVSRALGLTLALSVTLSGCTTVSNWFADDEEVEIRTLKPIEEKFQPQVIWETSVGDGVDDYFSRLRPVTNGDVVYMASRHGQVAAIDVTSGDKLWEKDFAAYDSDGMLSSLTQLWESGKSARIAGLTLDDNMLYVGTENGSVLALNNNDGSLAWSTSVPGEILAPPAVAEGLLVVNTGAGSLFALDTETGEQLWLNEGDVPPLSLRGISAPVAANGGTLVGTPTGKIQVNILESGMVAWETAITTPSGATELERIVDVDVTPLLYGGIVYAISYNGSLAAVELRSGRVIWKREYGAYRDLSMDGNELFLVDKNSTVYGLDRRNGVELWSQSSLKRRNLTEAQPVGNHLVVGDNWGYLHWLEKDSGAIVARYNLGGDDEDESVYVAPIQVGDNIIAVTQDGTIAMLSSEQ
ncbi:outer membrane protein assembly factor BamB [Salinimonas chungwhensis]|uniref:outer membrane protein assembly factor BamB n=1 Tax=Salinimonas chungwhensis TaxID=265425 RepID=UPI00036099C1|nr:outer membrane protein assembly factor BamB [Salinimonas chungwhensis]